jgi:hypothetical protein
MGQWVVGERGSESQDKVGQRVVGKSGTVG